MVNMNMIVNTSDLVGYEAEKIAKATSARSEALAKAVAIWENNQFKSVKRLGGLGMLAVTLAACNSDDDTAASDVSTQLAAAQAAQAAAETAQAAAEAALASVTASAAEAEAVASAVTVLTTGIDNVLPAATGDSLSGGNSGANQTLTSLDNIDMGGGDDTMVAQIGVAVTPNIANVETLIFSGSAGVVVNLSNTTGYTSVENTGSTAGGFTISNIAAGTEMKLSNSALAATFNHKAADLIGTTPAQTITLNNVSAGNTTMLAGIESLTINSIGGSTNTFGTATVAPSTVTITGDTALTYATAAVSVLTVDASAMTATTTTTFAPTAAFSYTGGAGTDTLTLSGVDNVTETVSLGAGNDKVTFATARLLNADVLDGGDGTDTLASISALFNALSSLTAATDNISNFETLTVTGALGHTITGANVQKVGLDTYNTAGGNGGFVMAAGDMNVNLTASLDGAFTLTDTGTATTDSVTITNTAAAADDMGDNQSITVTGYETVNLVTNSVGGNESQDFSTLSVTADTGGTSKLIVTGNSEVSFSGAVTASEIDFSGMDGEALGTVTVNMAAAPATTSLLITGSPGDDTLRASASATTIDGGAGNDTIFGGAAADTITGGTGVDTITGGGGNDTVTSGEGADTITMGAGTVNVDAGAGNDTVDMAGTLSVGDVVAGGDGTDILASAGAVAADGSASGITGFETYQQDTTNVNSNMAVFAANPGFTTLFGNAAIVNFTNASAAVTKVTADATAATSFAFARLTDGLTDSMTFTSTLTAAGAESAVSMSGALGLGGEETITIDSNNGSIVLDSNNDGVGLTSTSTKTIIVTGDNAVDLGVADGVNIASVDASANTGAFTAEFDASIVPLTVTGPTLAHVLNVNTGAGADTVIGSAGNDVIDLNNGNDTASGNAGNDTINGNNGADTLNGGAGDDTLNGGAGNDTISSGAGTDGVDGGTGADAFTGGTGVETYAQVLTGPSVAPTAKTTADGGNFAAGDTLTFGNGVDVITGFSTTTGAGATAASDDIIAANGAGGALPTTLIGVAENDLTAGTVNMIVSGAWDAASSTFTMTSDDLGPDSLFLSAANATGTSDDIMSNTNIIILVGAGTEDLVAAQFS
jgi:Ca2+-binding RTX toxin-like protein